MAILLIIAALILIGVIVLLINKRSGRGSRGPTVPERFKDVGPGEPRPKGPRATGPD